MQNIIAAAVNLIGAVLVVIGVVGIFKETEGEPKEKFVSVFKFFTTQSNVLYGVTAVIYAVARMQHTGELPQWICILKLVGTIGVTITLLTVFLFLWPVVFHDLAVLLKGPNLLLHLIVPLTAIVSFCLLERTTQITAAGALCGLSHFAVYAVGYMINAIRHAENGKVAPEHDWYGFLSGGMKYMPVALLAMTAGASVITYVLWAVNRAA